MERERAKYWLVQLILFAAVCPVTTLNSRTFRIGVRIATTALYGRNAERSLSAIRLRYILPARRQRSVCSCMDACMQAHEACLKVLCVLGPRHLGSNPHKSNG